MQQRDLVGDGGWVIIGGTFQPTNPTFFQNLNTGTEYQMEAQPAMTEPSQNTQLERIQEMVVRFRDERDWAQFHNAKDLSLALSIEAGELNECFLWKKPEEAKKEKIAEELADVFVYGLLLANETGLDVEEIITNKLRKNAEKYPVDKAKGSARKYNEL